MVRKPTSKETARKPNMREAILAAAEELFSTNGFNAVSVRDIAQAAGANPGSVTYHFKTKDGLLLEIYRRHCGPMNLRRSELLAAARRVRDLQDRLEAIVRAYVLPAFTSGSDLAGGGARFTRLRAVMSAEGNEVVRKIIAQTFDDTSHAFIDAIHESLPHIPRTDIVWRSHFLLGALYYSLVTPERVSRLSRGGPTAADAGRRHRAIGAGHRRRVAGAGARSAAERRPVASKLKTRSRSAAEDAMMYTPTIPRARSGHANAEVRAAAAGLRRALPHLRARREISLRARPALHAARCAAGGFPRAARQARRRPRRHRQCQRARHRQPRRARCDRAERRRLSRGRQYRRRHHRARLARAARRRLPRLPLQFRAPSRRRAGQDACSTASSR